MKKVIYFSLICGLLIIQKSNAQSPVGFPTGIIVGTPSVGLTLPAGYTMAVGGGVITEKVRVATTGTTFWADFVFDKSYKLRTLSEVSEYIKLNKHLPDVPSTADVNKDGIDLAQTQAILLQKVEELTLYVIEQNKKIERLNKKVKKLSKK
jgi:hypothetical protein